MDIEKSTFSGGLSNKVLKELAQIMQRGVSFRQLSIYLNRDELSIAQILSPYIENKMIYLRHPQPPFDHLPTIPRSLIVKADKLVQEGQSVKADKLVQEGQSVKADKFVQEGQSAKNYKIVCIDDSPTILSEIQRFLKDKPFEITALDDPVKASTVIFRLKPDLILLDITMPRINGYKLCSLLRNSAVFDKTPIIMVTSNTGLIDKAKAKIAGATDYLTKPFTKEGLMTIITKHLVMKIISKYSD